MTAQREQSGLRGTVSWLLRDAKHLLAAFLLFVTGIAAFTLGTEPGRDENPATTYTTISTIAFVVAGLTFLLGMALMEVQRRKTNKLITQAAGDLGSALRDRINDLNRAFADTAMLMLALQRDLAAQQAAREALIREAEDQQRLLDVDQEKAEKIRLILLGETKATIRAQRRQQWMFFALGVAVSVPVGAAINLLVP